MLTKLFEKLTKQFQEVPLFYAVLGLQDGEELNKEASHSIKLHPCLEEDPFLHEQLNGLVDYISKKEDSLSEKLISKTREILLFSVTFNLKHYQEVGEKGSCDLKLYSDLKGDPYIVEQLNGLVDHIRKNYNMESLSK